MKKATRSNNLLENLRGSGIEDTDFSSDNKPMFELDNMKNRSSLSKFVGAIMFLEKVTENEFKEGLRRYNANSTKKKAFSNEKRSLFNPNITIRAVLFIFRKILSWRVEILFRITNKDGKTTLYDPVDTMDKVFQIKLNSRTTLKDFD